MIRALACFALVLSVSALILKSEKQQRTFDFTKEEIERFSTWEMFEDMDEVRAKYDDTAFTGESTDPTDLALYGGKTFIPPVGHPLRPDWQKIYAQAAETKRAFRKDLGLVQKKKQHSNHTDHTAGQNDDTKVKVTQVKTVQLCIAFTVCTNLGNACLVISGKVSIGLKDEKVGLTGKRSQTLVLQGAIEVTALFKLGWAGFGFSISGVANWEFKLSNSDFIDPVEALVMCLVSMFQSDSTGQGKQYVHMAETAAALKAKTAQMNMLNVVNNNFRITLDQMDELATFKRIHHTIVSSLHTANLNAKTAADLNSNLQHAVVSAVWPAAYVSSVNVGKYFARFPNDPDPNKNGQIVKDYARKYGPDNVRASDFLLLSYINLKCFERGKDAHKDDNYNRRDKAKNPAYEYDYEVFNGYNGDTESDKERIEANGKFYQMGANVLLCKDSQVDVRRYCDGNPQCLGFRLSGINVNRKFCALSTSGIGKKTNVLHSFWRKVTYGLEYTLFCNLLTFGVMLDEPNNPSSTNYWRAKNNKFIGTKDNIAAMIPVLFQEIWAKTDDDVERIKKQLKDYWLLYEKEKDQTSGTFIGTLAEIDPCKQATAMYTLLSLPVNELKRHYKTKYAAAKTLKIEFAKFELTASISAFLGEINTENWCEVGTRVKITASVKWEWNTKKQKLVKTAGWGVAVSITLGGFNIAIAVNFGTLTKDVDAFSVALSLTWEGVVKANSPATNPLVFGDYCKVLGPAFGNLMSVLQMATKSNSNIAKIVPGVTNALKNAKSKLEKAEGWKIDWESIFEQVLKGQIQSTVTGVLDQGLKVFDSKSSISVGIAFTCSGVTAAYECFKGSKYLFAPEPEKWKIEPSLGIGTTQLVKAPPFVKKLSGASGLQYGFTATVSRSMMNTATLQKGKFTL